MKAFQWVVVHLLLALVVALTLPIVILVVLVALAHECMVDRRRAGIGAIPRNLIGAAQERQNGAPVYCACDS